MHPHYVSFEPVMEQFLAISAIPRGSGNEGAIASYIERFAKDRGLFCLRDSADNVFVRREAVYQDIRSRVEKEAESYLDFKAALADCIEQLETKEKHNG